MKPGFQSFLIMATFFAVPMFFCYWLMNGHAGLAAFAAVISGLFFAIGMRIFGANMKNRFKTDPPALDSNEPILYSGPANHMRGYEGVGGFLYLTSHRLLFRPHSFNVQKGDFSLPSSEIKSVISNQKTLGFLANRLIAVDNSGMRQTFIVYEPKVWAEKIAVQQVAN
jgi:GRAM domain